MSKDQYKRLFNARYDSIWISSDGSIQVSTPGCGCCGNTDTINKKQLKEAIKELELDLKNLKKLSREIKND